MARLYMTFKQRMASNNPLALFRVSSYSFSGLESATKPAPACTETVCYVFKVPLEGHTNVKF